MPEGESVMKPTSMGTSKRPNIPIPSSANRAYSRTSITRLKVLTVFPSLRSNRIHPCQRPSQIPHINRMPASKTRATAPQHGQGQGHGPSIDLDDTERDDIARYGTASTGSKAPLTGRQHSSKSRHKYGYDASYDDRDRADDIDADAYMAEKADTSEVYVQDSSSSRSHSPPHPHTRSHSQSKSHSHHASPAPGGENGDAEKAHANGTASPQASAPSPPQFPEGGLEAWLTVIGGSMVLFCTFGVVQSFGVYQDYYKRISLTEHTPSDISWIGSLQVFFLFALGLPTGKLFDEGYFHACVLAGSIVYLVSIFLLSLVQPHHYYQNILAQGVGMGIGMGMMFLPALTVTSHYFRKKRSAAMGVVIAGSSLGGCLYPILLNNVLSRNGFAWGVRAVGFIDLGLLILANLLMKTRLPSRRQRAKAGVVNKPIAFKKIILDWPYMVFVAGSFLVFWGLFFPFFYLQFYAAQFGVEANLVKYSITIMNAASVFGRTLPNFLADKYGPFNVMIPSTVISGGLVYAMFGASSQAGLVTFAIFYGFFSGGCECFSYFYMYSNFGVGPPLFPPAKSLCLKQGLLTFFRIHSLKLFFHLVLHLRPSSGSCVSGWV
ncbi:hypothetical protein HGRIS_014066 [Hohenbuehelia grisea]|uniref:Major facilitator superfamily (MFS) profile domain-containing protein n=1 Tax=Hohenbuehelia grisea TaxID=104357 RepID=A0ABR3JTN5_9AGAR